MTELTGIIPGSPQLSWPKDKEAVIEGKVVLKTLHSKAFRD